MWKQNRYRSDDLGLFGLKLKLKGTASCFCFHLMFQSFLKKNVVIRVWFGLRCAWLCYVLFCCMLNLVHVLCCVFRLYCDVYCVLCTVLYCAVLCSYAVLFLFMLFRVVLRLVLFGVVWMWSPPALSRCHPAKLWLASAQSR